MNKTQAQAKIEEFFKDIKNKNEESIRKIKRLAMHHHIRLGDKRKLFCRSCYSPRLKIKKISKNMITKECEDCKKLMRLKI